MGIINLISALLVSIFLLRWFEVSAKKKILVVSILWSFTVILIHGAYLDDSSSFHSLSFYDYLTQVSPASLFYLVFLAITLQIFWSDRGFAPVHEGEIFLMFFTFLYVMNGLFPPEDRILTFLIWILAIPGLFFLVKEIFSNNPLKTSSRFCLSFLFSLMAAVIIFHQIHLGSAPQLLPGSGWLDWVIYSMHTFAYQLTIFWGFLHVVRLWRLLPGRSEIGYRDRLKSETIPEFIKHISDQNISTTTMLVAGVVHIVPLIVNSYFELVSPQVMVAYAVMASPLIVEIVVTQMKKSVT